MNNKKHLIAGAFMLIPLLYLAITWTGMPQTIPLHFDIKGNVNRWGNKAEILSSMAVLSGVTILLYLLLCNAYRFDAKKRAVENKDRLQNIALAVTVFLTLLQTWIIYISTTTGQSFSIKVILIGVCILFSILGNYMYNLKPNYFAGLRLPWTLENEDNWRKTHHYASRIWFAGGLLAALVCLLLPVESAVIVSVVLLVLMIILPTIYSYRLYKKRNI